MNACATALPQTASTPAKAVPVAADVPDRAAPARPPPATDVDLRRQAARVVATTRRHWLDDAP